jgi:hypothetical protein
MPSLLGLEENTDETRFREAELCCMMRERLILRAREIADFSGNYYIPPKHAAAAVRELCNIENDLRDLGIRTVNKIVSWTIGRPDAEEAWEPEPFLFEVSSRHTT